MPQPQPNPSALFLLRLWAQIGAQSFGGGQAVFLLAFRQFVEVRAWLTAEEWAEAFGLCQLAPGMNLVALAALTGRRLAGLPGAVLAPVGLLAPSIVITVVLAAALGRLQHLPGVAAALHGVVLAATGGSLVVTWNLAKPLFRSSARDGRAMLAAAIAVTLLAALLLLLQVPVVAIMLGAGAALAIAAWRLVVPEQAQP